MDWSIPVIWRPILITTMAQPGTLQGIDPSKKRVVVFIALKRLSHENGLFLGEGFEMSTGEDFIMGGWEPIPFPANGGGLAVLLFLDI